MSILRLFIFSRWSRLSSWIWEQSQMSQRRRPCSSALRSVLSKCAGRGRDREERAAFTAVQALMTPEWMSSSMIVHSIPKGTSAAQLENDPRLLEACLKIATIMEGIGYSVYARIVPLSVAADLIGGTARIAWQKFRPFVEVDVCVQARKKVGSGSNGWWNNSNATV